MNFVSENGEVVFISVLGVNFKIGKFKKLGVIDEITTDQLKGLLETFNTQSLVFDCSSLIYADDQKAFEHFFNLSQFRDRKMLFFNLEDELLERIEKNLKNSGFKWGKSEFVHPYFSDGTIKYVYINDNQLINNVANSLKENDIKILKSCSEAYLEEPYQLLSTPFWTNYYFDISKLFSINPLKSSWILSRLCDKFRILIRQNKSVLLISTSLYGTILTTLMKEVLSDGYKIETICFDRLGPDLLINEVNMHKKEDYDYIVHVCDFIIGGTELKILKAILALRKLAITHVIAIGTYMDLIDYHFDSISMNNILKTNEICSDINYSLKK